MPDDPQGQLIIHTTGGADSLFELLEWLNDDDDLRGRVSLPPNRIQPGRMGDLYDVLVVAVGAGGIAPALARSLTGWLTARRSDIAVSLKFGDHPEITIDGKGVSTPELAQTLQVILDKVNKPQ